MPTRTHQLAAAAAQRPTAAVDPEHSDRLAETGAHVARIVHELNAPLGLLRGSLDNLADYMVALLDAAAPPPRAPRRLGFSPSTASADYAADNAASLLTICRQSIERLAGLVAELREWNDRPSRALAIAPVDLQQAVIEAVSLVGGARERPVAIERELVPGLPPVLANRAALIGVLTNVLGNAVDAVAAVTRPSVRLDARLAGSAIVEVRVRDNGPGIAADERERVFLPFFTTKGNGAGLGLGLAIARDLLQRSGGSIALGDAAAGAEFVIRLPAATPADGETRL